MSTPLFFSRLSALALAGMLLTANLSQAQSGREGKSKVWSFLVQKYDKDMDGKVSQDEYDRGAETFSRLDRNDDGVLTKDDWDASGQRPKARLPRVAPKEGDPAPDFELTYVKDPEKTARLSDFVGKRPVALIFGSCT